MTGHATGGRSRPEPPPAAVFEDVIRRALAEDLGTAGDLSTTASIGAEVRASGRVVARQPGCIAGIGAAALVVERVAGGVAGSAVDVSVEVADGDRVEAGTTLLSVTGSARTILTAERTALNLLGHLSGIATATAAAVDVVVATDARIADTRKTTPGLRAVEKYAVRCGGGLNHRLGLDDAAMLKENHLAWSGGVAPALAAVRAQAPWPARVIVEAETEAEALAAVRAGADGVLLDGFSPGQLVELVPRLRELAAGAPVVLEASGVDPQELRACAASGVDLISTSAPVTRAPWLDLSMRFSLPLA